MSRLREWAIPGAIILILLVASVLLARPEDPEEGVAYSTYNPSSSGLYGIYQFLAQEGQAPRRWRRPPGELPETVTRLVVWWPPELTEREWQELEAWVAGAPDRTLIMAAPVGPSSPLWERVAAIQGRPALPGDADLHPAAPSPTGTIARPARLEPWTAGVRQVVGGAPPLPFTYAWRQPVRIYLADAAGNPAAVGWDEGPGRVILFLSPDWLTNGALARGDNLRLALGLFPGRPGSLAFSEYHRGLQDPDPLPGPSAPIAGTGPWRMVAWQLGAALLLYLLLRAARFGSPLPDPPVTPRESLEFVHALGNLYRKARARGAVTQALAAGLRATLRRAGASGPGDTGLARLYAARTGRPAEEVLNTLAALEADRQPDERELVALARRTEELQRRVEDGNGRRRA